MKLMHLGDLHIGRTLEEFVSIKPKRDLREITGSMKDLLAKDNVKDTDDFIYAKVTDETFVSNVINTSAKSCRYKKCLVYR